MRSISTCFLGFFFGKERKLFLPDFYYTTWCMCSVTYIHNSFILHILETAWRGMTLLFARRHVSRLEPHSTLLLAVDQWQTCTNVGRLRFAHTVTYMMRHRFSHFVKGNQRTPTKNGEFLCLGDKI